MILIYPITVPKRPIKGDVEEIDYNQEIPEQHL